MRLRAPSLIRCRLAKSVTIAAVLVSADLGHSAARGPALAGGDERPASKFAVDVIARGFNRPVAMTFAPDGRIFVAEQRGVVWVVKPGDIVSTPFIDLQDEVGYGGDRGMLGIALDPNFLDNRLVYLLFTVDPIP